MSDEICSVSWDGMPALGTAASATFWVLLEQDGPWGRKAFTESRLDPHLGATLQSLCTSAGGRMLLVRRPSNHAVRPESCHRVWLCGGPAGSGWLASTKVDDPSQLLELLDDLDGGIGTLAVMPAPPLWAQRCEPLLLVCANGRRDRCCALEGGPLARELDQAYPGRVWEATHLGGHRFAATTLQLPSRQMLGRVDAELAARAMESSPVPAGTHHDRGLTHLPQLLRVADAWLRGEAGLADPAAVSWSVEDDIVCGSLPDGRSWRLRITQRVDEAVALPSSCGVAAVPLKLWDVSPL